MNEQFEDFPTLELFIYPSCLCFMFIYQNHEHFKSLGLKVVDEDGDPIPVYEWNDIFLRYDNSNYIYSIDREMNITYMLIYDIDPPRMLKEGKYLLQSSPNTRVGD